MIFAFTRLHKLNRVGLDQHQRPRIIHETVEITAWIQRAAFLPTEKGVICCPDIHKDMIVLGECKAWRGEKIKKLRPSFTVIIKLTGSYALKIALINGRKKLIFPFFPFLSFTSHLL